MKKLRWLLCWIMLSLFAPSVCVADLSPIVEMVHHAMPGAHVGVLVQDMDTGQWLYRYHPLDHFTPASNNKLFVASAALIGLGSQWQYTTTVKIPRKRIKGGVVKGDMVWNFVGDPTFTESDLKKMVANIRRKGVRRVTGKVVINKTRFAGPVYAPGWTQDSLAWSYSAPVSAVVINENAMPLTLRASDTIGKPVKVQMNRYQKQYLDSASIKTVSADDAMNHCSLDVYVNQRNHISMHGCWPIDRPKKTLRVAMRNPDQYLIDRMKKLFKQNKIKIQGGYLVAHRKIYKKYRTIARYQSPELSEMLGPVLRDSDNLYAESILKTLGWKFTNVGSFQEGVNTMQDLLEKKLDIDFVHSDLFDGSGASRYDQVTPELMARLLYVMYHDRKLYRHFYRGLPDAGFNGTLQNRMTSFDLKKNVKAKTGTLKHVSTLSGYMRTQSKKNLGFVILINGVVGSLQPARDVQNRICQFLYQL